MRTPKLGIPSEAFAQLKSTGAWQRLHPLGSLILLSRVGLELEIYNADDRSSKESLLAQINGFQETVTGAVTTFKLIASVNYV